MKRVVTVLLVLCMAGVCVPASGQPGRLRTASGKHCRLCGKNSLWDYYHHFDSVGILNLSCGQIMDVSIRNYDDDGTLLDDSGHTTVYYYTDGEGRCCRLTTTGSQSICRIKLSWNEDTSVTLEDLAGLYCKPCMEKIKMLNEEWASGQTDDKSCPFAVTDFVTGELYSLNGVGMACFIRDYYVDLECDGQEIKGTIVYKLVAVSGQEQL